MCSPPQADPNLHLVFLGAPHQAAFEHFYQDMLTNDPQNAEFYSPGAKDFLRYTQQLSEHHLGRNLPQGYVPCSYYWLFDGQVIYGAIRLRHRIDDPFLANECGHIGYDVAPSQRHRRYGTIMLSLALEKASNLGIERVLLTASEDNVASRRVIEANGGQFDGVIYGEVFAEMLARYWIHCAVNE